MFFFFTPEEHVLYVSKFGVKILGSFGPKVWECFFLFSGIHLQEKQMHLPSSVASIKERFVHLCIDSYGRAPCPLPMK